MRRRTFLAAALVPAIPAAPVVATASELLSALAAGARVVCCLPGVYAVDRPLILAAGVVLEGVAR